MIKKLSFAPRIVTKGELIKTGYQLPATFQGISSDYNNENITLADCAFCDTW